MLTFNSFKNVLVPLSVGPTNVCYPLDNVLLQRVACTDDLVVYMNSCLLFLRYTLIINIIAASFRASGVIFKIKREFST